jgi:hypothetical protein
MKFGIIKIKNSRISLLQEFGMALIGLIFSSFVFAQIPYSEGKVYVCPLAKSMEEINPKCQCRIDLVLGERVTNTCGTTTYEMTLTITEYEGKEYFAILGFENGGAGVNFTPEAKILAPSEGYVGQEILFDGSQSFDQNKDPLDFYWDFGDKKIKTGQKISYIYQNPGEYTIILTVSDGISFSSTTKTIKILPSKFALSNQSFEKKENKILKEIKKITKILKIENQKEETETSTQIQKFKPQNVEIFEQKTTPLLISIFFIFILLFFLLRIIKILKK